MNKKEILSYYSREDVQEALLKLARSRETVGAYKEGGFDHRPNMLVYAKDIGAMVRRGIVEFHTSVERWSQPMGLSEGNYDELRSGWDLILDIDCERIEHGKAAAEAFIWGLKKHGVKSISLKFTGGTGFHIGVPWEAIPKSVDNKPTEKQFPELPRNILSYLRDFVWDRLEKKLLELAKPEQLARQAGKPLGEIFAEDGYRIKPFEIVDVDPVLISQRHLFRMPYSLHRKTFLASLPLEPRELVGFSAAQAKPDRVKADKAFLEFEPLPDRSETESLIAEAMDYWSSMKKEEEVRKRRRAMIRKAVPAEFFPPCIKTISDGLADGRKRSVFILINFLSTLKWKWEDIEDFIVKWNQKNKPRLRDSHISSQLRYQRDKSKRIPPPNCAAEGWYTSFGVCKPDHICGKNREIKNPVNYPLRKMSLRK